MTQGVFYPKPDRRALMAGGLAAAGVVTAGAAHGGTSDDPGPALRALIAESVKAEAALDPLQAVRLGPEAAGRFMDPLSDAYAGARLAAKREDLRRLGLIDRTQLGEVDRLAYDVFRYKTQEALDEFSSGLFEVARLTPLDPSFGLQVSFPDAASGEGAPFRTVEDYENGLKRLEGFAGYLDGTVQRLKEGLAKGYVQPRILVQNVLVEVDVMLATPPRRRPSTSRSASCRPRSANPTGRGSPAPIATSSRPA